MPQTLTPRHFLLAILVMAVWGSNFVVAKYALQYLPPLFVATLRFALAFFPAMLFLPRPRCAPGNLALYGLLIGVGQFGMLYLALDRYMSPGLASLVIQTQVFFTIGLAMFIRQERVRGHQIVALLIAGAGLWIILHWTDGSATPTGVVLMLIGAMAWAGGNIVAMQAGTVNFLAYVVWASAFAVPPLLVLSLVFEGWDRIALGAQQADSQAWLATLWQAVGNTWFGYGAWGWLLARYPAGTVAPMALLVPVFGMGSSALLMGESLPIWKLVAAILIIAGLALNLLWPRLRPG